MLEETAVARLDDLERESIRLLKDSIQADPARPQNLVPEVEESFVARILSLRVARQHGAHELCGSKLRVMRYPYCVLKHVLYHICIQFIVLQDHPPAQLPHTKLTKNEY